MPKNEEKKTYLTALNRAVDRFLANRKAVIGTGVGLFAVLVFVVAVSVFLSHRSRNAMALLEQYRESSHEKDLETLINRYGGTIHGALGRLEKAKMLFNQGQYKPAETIYRDLMRSSQLKWMENLIIIAVAKCEIERGRQSEAVSFLRKEIDAADNEAYTHQYKLELAKIYLKTDPLKARELLLELKAERVAPATRLLRREGN
jgi:predicted negative regulator of RcsB-dependent stress response